ncbi:hypothetical protein PBRA_009327 [Plasmodiophora brassicae]|uniref:Uncharacterized protein n=1 Tax=Plasmodiophora brassicae TaxID=37360 RepID=A0A0G4J6E0_PLABS|nr:hypothetical protein PBRA_009327 [Plasmodiophora brassicae]
MMDVTADSRISFLHANRKCWSCRAVHVVGSVPGRAPCSQLHHNHAGDGSLMPTGFLRSPHEQRHVAYGATSTDMILHLAMSSRNPVRRRWSRPRSASGSEHSSPTTTMPGPSSSSTMMTWSS